MDEDKLVIATTDPAKALYVIAKSSTNNDRIIISFTNKYAPTVEYLIRILRKGFGWTEVDRGETETNNTKCRYYKEGLCTGPPSKKSREPIRCLEHVRIACKSYDPMYEHKFTVNTVTIEKSGPIRGM